MSPSRPLLLALSTASLLACAPDAPVAQRPAPSAAATAPPTPPSATAGEALSADRPFRPATARELRRLGEQLEARAVFINVWASWCASCKHELPMLDRLAQRYRARGIAFVTLTVDEDAALPAAARVHRELGLSLPTYRVAEPLEVLKPALNPAWPGMLPASFLYDATGKLRYFWGGEAYEHEITPILDGLLAGRPIDGAAQVGLAPGRTE